MASASAFAPPRPPLAVTRSPTISGGIQYCYQPALRRPRGLIPTRQGTQLNLFGLGAGEIVLILVVLGFVLGPENLGRVFQSTSKRASAIQEELKNVPEEFAKGVEEGEMEARSRKARRVRRVVDDDE